MPRFHIPRPIRTAPGSLPAIRERLPRRGTTMALGMMSILLAAAACAPASSSAVQASPDASGAPSDRARRARIIPLVDHHQHITGPTAASRRPASPPAVTLPAPIDSLLRERSRLHGTGDAGGLYTDDAQVVDFSEESLPWVRGREAAAGVVAVFQPGRHFVPNALVMDGAAAHVTGEMINPESGRAVAAFAMGLRRDGQGRWKIASEVLTLLPEWPFEKVITADDLVDNLDEAGIDRAVVLSVGYWFGGPEPGYTDEEYAKVRAENDWTAA